MGSKRFTESYILAEVVVRAAGGPGHAIHRPGLGNTAILHSALRTGAIDVYPEYSGTIAREILKLEGNPSLQELNDALASQGLAVSVPIGFNNSYAIGVRKNMAVELKLERIGDLVKHPDLRFGLSHEFLGRKDGWIGLSQAYSLQRFRPIGLDHGLAYESLAAGRIDVIDVYSTDAKILRYGIHVLADDRGYFPRYDAVLIHRSDIATRFPRQWEGVTALAGRIDAARMTQLNAASEVEGRTFADAAATFFDTDAKSTPVERGFTAAMFGPDFGRLTAQHLLLVFGPVVVSVLIGIPLGIAAARVPRLSQPVFAFAGLVQTIPSLALLAFLVAALGSIGIVPAVIALFLYGLLPIVRNTHTGLLSVSRGLLQAATALGLSQRHRLWSVELPLAAPAILAGIKTSAVINVGTATIAAFVGAGGYGERIATGLALNDSMQLLAGAVPAALLAILIQGALDLVERYALPWQRAQARVQSTH